MVQGSWSVLLEHEEFFINQGDIIFLPAGIAHCGLEPCKANARTIFIHFSMEKSDQKITYPVKERIDKIPESFVVTSISHDNGNVFALFQGIARIFQSNVPLRELRCRALLDLLFAELCDIYRGDFIRRDFVIEKLVEYMVDHPEKFFSIAELAGKAILSERSLTRRFRMETGKTVHQYQIDYKLDRIANLLKTRSFTGLRDLALNFGFYDEFHLSSSFKKKFGVSPGYFGRKR
jgi:AraC-like DNA-binding protein